MPRLIIYPHGLGDIILLTPALRALAGEKPHVAILSRFRGTGILDHCPHIKGVSYVLPDPWNDHGGKVRCRKQGEKLANHLGLDPVWIWHRPGLHKIKENMFFLGVANGDYRTDYFWTRHNMSQAVDFLSIHRKRFGFLHCRTGMPGMSTAAAKKDFDSTAGRQWLLDRGCEEVVEVGVEMEMSLPMPTQFLIMKAAEKVCLADSVFYHACHAMGKTVDFAYFGRGADVHKVVRPLHDHKELVSWTPPTSSE